MKKTILTAFAVIVSLAAHAQLVDLGVPATIVGSSTTNVAKVIDVSKQGSAAVQITFKLMEAGTGAQTFVFSRSNDRTTWSTLTTTVGVAANGTTAVSLVTNIVSQGARYIRLNSWQNGDAAIATNIVATYVVKTGAQ